MIRVAVCSAAWSVSVCSRLSFILHEVLSCLATVHYFFQHLARFFSLPDELQLLYRYLFQQSPASISWLLIIALQQV